jgi:ABC-2 type transport system permease protein
MMTATVTEPARAGTRRPRSAFSNLVRTEFLLLVREVVPLLWGAGFPVVLLCIMGVASHGPDQALGGLSLVAVYEPILIAFTCATFALQGLPAVLAGYRERGILRRLNATPVGAGRLLGAQLAVNLAVALVSVAAILVVGRLAFGVALPREAAGFCLALLLTAAAMLSLGLLVASVARTGRVAAATGTMLFLPLMFFAGLWIPRSTMPAGLLRIGDDTPLGAAVAALQDSMAGQWPSAASLGVLAGYAVLLSLGAWRLFRWE